MSEDENIPVYGAEIETFGFSHTDVGRLLVERWNFPPALIGAVANLWCFKTPSARCGRSFETPQLTPISVRIE